MAIVLTVGNCIYKLQWFFTSWNCILQVTALIYNRNLKVYLAYVSVHNHSCLWVDFHKVHIEVILSQGRVPQSSPEKMIIWKLGFAIWETAGQDLKCYFKISSNWNVIYCAVGWWFTSKHIQIGSFWWNRLNKKCFY